MTLETSGKKNLMWKFAVALTATNSSIYSLIHWKSK